MKASTQISLGRRAHRLGRFASFGSSSWRGSIGVIGSLCLLLAACSGCDDGNRFDGKDGSKDAGETSRVPRVVSLTPLGTRALQVLALPHRVVAADAASGRLLSPPPPEATLEAALAHRPDLVLVGEVGPGNAAGVEALRSAGIEVVEVAPHQMIEALALYEELGALLGEPRHGIETANRIGDPFAAASAEQLGRTRPRIAVLVGLEPLLLAGGHSFETDMVETGGGESITHGDEALRTPTDPRRLRDARPDLVVIGTAALDAPGEATRARIVAALAPLPVRFTVLDGDALWLEDAGDPIAAWQALVAEARLARSAQSAP